jgi:hypothetical protein
METIKDSHFLLRTTRRRDTRMVEMEVSHLPVVRNMASTSMASVGLTLETGIRGGMTTGIVHMASNTWAIMDTE